MNARPETLWRIVPMSPAHLPAVMAIERQAYRFPWTEGIFADCLRVGYSAWVLSNTISEVLGYGLMSMAVEEAHVLNLCVTPDCRRRGAGRLLMRHLLQVAVAAGVREVLLEVRRGNQPAIALYRSLGFAEIAVRKDYYPADEGREDALLLSRRVGP